MGLIMNPGTGKVKGATEENAITNIKQFVEDLELKGVNWVRLSDRDDTDGRFAFLLWKGKHCHEVEIPGCAIEKLRPSDGVFPPRLYVDGSSWWWGIALGMCKFGVEDE